MKDFTEILHTPTGPHVSLGSAALSMISITSGAIALHLLCNMPHVTGMNDVVMLPLNALSLGHLY